MPNVIVTGGPGAGKTTLLTELAALGYATVEESARAIIAERLASGASRRPDFPAFAREILRRDIEKYRGQPRTSNWVFFDRGVLDALGMLHSHCPRCRQRSQKVGRRSPASAVELKPFR